MKIVFRKYNSSDLKKIKNLHELALKKADAWYKSGKWDHDFDDIQNIYIDFLVGYSGDNLIAMGALKKISKDTAEIKRMRVHPDFQKKGIGQELLEILEQKAQKIGFKKVQLDTTVKQKAAQKLYKKNGYIEIRREKTNWPLEMIFYEKII